MVVFLLNGTQYARPKKWRYAVRKAKIGRYAVRKGGGGVTLNYVFPFAGCPVFLVFPSFLDCPLLFPSFLTRVLVFLVFHKKVEKIYNNYIS